MKKRGLLMVAAALAVGTSVVGAQERPALPAPGAQVLPAHEIVTILRSTGFDPVGRPVRMGARYEVQAIDPDDFDVRLLVDGRTGRILTVRDSEDGGPMAQHFPQEGYREASGRFGPLSYGPAHQGRIAPPRGIPTPRASATAEPQKAPVPRPRPDARQPPAVASNAETGAPAQSPAKHAPVAVPEQHQVNAPNAKTAVPSTASAPAAPESAGAKAAVAATTMPAPAGPPAPDATAAARNTAPNPAASPTAGKANGNVAIIPVAPLE